MGYGSIVIRFASTVALACLLLGCQRGKSQAVVVRPTGATARSNAIPSDPFGSPSPAYTRLREVIDAALAKKWSGNLEDFAPWLESETEAMERALALLKAIRVGPVDVYAVANGRIATLYDHIVIALTEASQTALGAGFKADWRDQEDRVLETESAYWARCVRGCSMAGTHLDAWDLYCRNGLANSQVISSP